MSTLSSRRHGQQVRVRCKGSGVQMCAASTTKQPDAESLSETWAPFAEKMKTSGEIPEIEEWHDLLDGCIRSNDVPGSAIWLMNLMRDTGRKPNATTYDKALLICNNHDDRVAAFHLVEHMHKDKVLLGDVELPGGMEETLRKILPPEAFE